MKYSLFFGAGAEMCFDLPSGDKFTKDSVLGKDNEFTNALAQKYSQENEITSKKIKYKSESFFYARNSLSFRNCIFKTAKQLFQDYKEANDQDAINFFKQFLLADKNSSESDDEIADRTDNLSKDSIENIKKYYDAIIKGEDDLLKFEEKYSDEIKKNLIINGEIEKDFYSLIEYDENTSQKYFRLFNFFWSSYFSIVMPLVEKKIEKSYKGNKYKYILDNLYTITDEIYSKEFLDNFLKEKNDENYYEKFNDFKLLLLDIVLKKYVEMKFIIYQVN